MTTITLVDHERVEDIVVGRWKNHTMLVSFGLRRYHGPGRTTTEHEENVQDWWDFTAMGSVMRRGIMERGGQCLDALLDITTLTSPWTLGDVASLHQLWERWHLNGMRAACAHQTGDVLVYEDNGWGGERISCERTVCPVTGYRYGSSWLLEPLPDDTITEVRRLLALAKEASA